jgi:hypothetical protein
VALANVDDLDLAAFDELPRLVCADRVNHASSITKLLAPSSPREARRRVITIPSS